MGPLGPGFSRPKTQPQILPPNDFGLPKREKNMATIWSQAQDFLGIYHEVGGGEGAFIGCPFGPKVPDFLMHRSKPQADLP